MSKKEKKVYDVEKIRKNLSSLAEKKPERVTCTACGIVAELEDEIRALVKAGYTVLEISEALNNDVADISVGTFQNYISKMKITIDKMGTKNKKNKTKKSNNKEPKKIEGCAEAQAAAQAFFDLAAKTSGMQGNAEDTAQILEETAAKAEKATDSQTKSDLAHEIAREFAEQKMEKKADADAEEEQIPAGMTKKQWRLAHPVGFNPKPV